jgi:AbrB family looped-hinge helix DNA binding protein
MADEEKCFSWDDHFYGAVTVGERGQIVVPAEARKRFHIEPGDKLLIMGDPGKRSLMLCKMDTLREFMTVFQEGLARVEREMTLPRTPPADPSSDEETKPR